MATSTMSASNGSSTEQAKSSKLGGQAATAALYASKSEHSSKSDQKSDGNRFLDDNSRLSSAGAAASLRYAKPQDLPSFPSVGLGNGDSAAGAAASLGWANQKSFEYWKPDPSSSASKAATGAFNYKMAPLWQPEQSANGAKAALLAARDGGKVEIWKPEASAWGNSAATQAFKKERTGGLSPQLDYGYTAVGRQGSMMAATGAMSGSRKRAESTPAAKLPTYPDEANATANALSAATFANKPSRKSRTEFSAEAGATPFTNMPKEMYTSNPPVAPEVDEKNRANVLHASAVAMAQQMYKMQQKQIDDATKAHQSDGFSAANSAHGRNRANSESDDEVTPMRFNNLQEAAQKLAQERLAKLHDEHAQNREYRDYYGGSTAPASRLSLRGRPRRRASSDGSLDDDKLQSQKIRAQMSLFSSNLSQVNSTKRQQDRDNLMAIAQRNVTKSLHGMDERALQQNGRATPAMMSEWEIQAQAAAQKGSDARMENYGKVNIGGGKFINQSAIDLVARRNVQPVLDEINEKAEQQRVRDAELKLEQEAQKRAAENKRTRENEVKEVNRKLKEQDKQEERARKEEEKASKAEAKRTAKEDKRRSKDASAAQNIVVAKKSPALEPATIANEPETLAVEEPHTTTDTADAYAAPSDFRTSMELQQQERLEQITHPDDGLETSSKGVKGWLKNRFSRRMSRGQKSELSESSTDKAFVGGAALAGSSSTSLDHRNSSAIGNGVDSENRTGRTKRRESSVSAVSVISQGNERGTSPEEFEEARDHFNEDLAPPVNFAVVKSSSPVRDSKFHEVI